MADEDGHLPGERRPQLVETLDLAAGALGDEHRDTDRAVEVGQRRGVGEVGLRQGEQRGHPGVVRGDDAAVDHPRAGLRLGEGRDDHQLVGVRDDHALHGVGVVGGPAQDGAPLTDPDDPRERPRGARRVPDDVDEVARNHPLAAQLARLHRDERLLAGQHGVATAVDAGDHAGHGVVVRGTLLGAWARPLAGSHPHVGLVVTPRHQARAPSIAVHSRAKPGSVLAVLSMSSTVMPGTARPTSAPAVAIRWSA